MHSLGQSPSTSHHRPFLGPGPTHVPGGGSCLPSSEGSVVLHAPQSVAVQITSPVTGSRVFSLPGHWLSNWHAWPMSGPSAHTPGSLTQRGQSGAGGGWIGPGHPEPSLHPNWQFGSSSFVTWSWKVR